MGEPVRDSESFEIELKEALVELQKSLVDVLNGQADIEVFAEALKRWEGVRQRANDLYNQGVALGFNKWSIAVFPLTGDIARDIDQINFKRLEGQE